MESFFANVPTIYLLNELGYTLETFTKSTEMSLYNLFSLKDSSFLDKDCFSRIAGEGEGKIYTAGGALITVHLVKEDSVDVDGKPIWIMSVNVDWENENLSLIMEALGSASWYMDCDCESNITKVYWSAAFRKLLGYHDTIDFPNRLESWQIYCIRMIKISFLPDLQMRFMTARIR